MRAGNINGGLLELADETGRVAESIGEPAIGARLHEIALELLELALAERRDPLAAEGSRQMPLRMRR
jgi:hypothetical protein